MKALMNAKVGHGLLALTLCLLFQVAAAATMYRWVDDNGTVHYGENPPDGVEAVPVGLDPVPSSDDDDPYAEARTETGEGGELNMAEERRQERAERVAAQKERDEVLSKQCASERKMLDQLMPRTNVIVADEAGNTWRLDDNERLERIAQAEKFIEENCEDY